METGKDKKKDKDAENKNRSEQLNIGVVSKCDHPNAYHAHGYRWYCPDCMKYTDMC